MMVTSFCQEKAWNDGKVPAPEEIAPDFWMVAMSMPGIEMPYSFSYVKLGADGVYILDPGWGDTANINIWSEFLSFHGRKISDIVMILVTHSHPDHIGLATSLRELSGAELIMSSGEAAILRGEVKTGLKNLESVERRLERWGVPAQVREQMLAGFASNNHSANHLPDRLIVNGDEINFGGSVLTAVLTPGHTSGHMCFVDHSSEKIFTGDHVLPQISPGLGLGASPESDPVFDYVSALEGMSQFDHCEVLPGHEYRFAGLAERSEQIAAHHLRRSRAFRELEPELGDATVWKYASLAPWSRGWKNLEGFMLHSALTQTELHLISLRNGSLDRWLDGTWAMKPSS